MNGEIETEAGYIVTLPLNLQGYKTLKMLGRGLTSVVFLVEKTTTRQRFACKVIPRKSFEKDGFLEHLERELRLIQTLKHPNIINVIDIQFITEYVIVIMEHGGQDLLEYLTHNFPLPHGIIQNLFHQLVSAVAYLHSHSIAHRDLKPENILIDSENVLKICDFGMCHETNCTTKLLKTQCGTVLYASPEVLSGKKYDGHKVDIWSLGIILFALFTQSLPWASQDLQEVIECIENARVTIPPSIPPIPAAIITSCLCLDPTKRPTPTELLENAWIQSISHSPFKPQKVSTRSNGNIAFTTKTTNVRIRTRPSLPRPATIHVPSETS